MVKALLVHPGHDYSTADVWRGWGRGLIANGVDVKPFNLNHRVTFYSEAHLKADDGEFYPAFTDLGDVARCIGNSLHAACYQMRPDVVVVISGVYLPAYAYDVIRGHGTKVVVVHTETPYEDERQLLVAPHADLNIVNDPATIDRYQELAPTIYVPHAYDPTVHHPGPSDWDLDVVWVGTAGSTFPSRTRFMEQVDWGGASVGLAGLWLDMHPGNPLWQRVLPDMGDSIDNDQTVDLYRGSRITFNLYRSADDLTDGGFVGGWAMGPREVETCATGLFMARHSPPNHGGEGDDLLPMLPTFTDPGELSDIVAHYLAHPEQRLAAATAARAAVADRTFENHAADLLRRVGS